MACYVTDSGSKRRFRVEGEGFLASPVLNLDRVSDCNAHRIGWGVQRIVKAWDQLAIFVGVRIREKLVQAFIVLRRP